MKPSIPQGGPPMSELLVADVDPRSVDLCRDIASAARLTLRSTQDSEATLDGLESGLVDVLLLSEQLPGGSELELLRHIRYWYPETQVIMTSENPSYASAVQAIKVGAFDYLPKPLESQLLQTTIERAMEHHRLEGGRTTLREPIDGESTYGIVGKTAVMWKLYGLIKKVSANIHPVLILRRKRHGERAGRARHSL